MSTTHPDHLPTTRGSTRLSRPLKTALLMLAIVGGFYLLREHWNPIAGNWVYLLLLACPLMHLFHGHGSHVNESTPPTRAEDTVEHVSLLVHARLHPFATSVALKSIHGENP